MEDEIVELLKREQPVAAYGGVLGRDGLERAAGKVGGEDDVDDVLGGEAPGRCDRIDERDGALQRQLNVLADDSDLFAQLPHECLHEALAGVDAAAGEEPVLLAGLLVPAEEHTIVPAQQRRDADPRLSAHASACARGPEAANAPLALGQLLGLDELRERVAAEFGERFESVRMLLPYDEGARLAELYALGAPIQERVDQTDGVFVRAHLPRRELPRFAPYLLAEARDEQTRSVK